VVNARDLAALSPWLILAGGSLWILISIAVRRSHLWAYGSTLLFLGASLASLPFVLRTAPHQVENLAVMDAFAVVVTGLLSAAALVVVPMSRGFLEHIEECNVEEFYALVLLATLGASVLVASRHFMSLFLGLEILSVSLYVLIAYSRTRAAALEAGLKYLVLTGASSAVLAFGMALVYSETGTMDLVALSSRLPGIGLGRSMVWTGVAMLVAGLAFKLALVPFHMWAPDVYQGAPAPIAAFMTTVSKGAVLALVVRWVVVLGAHDHVLTTQMMTLFSVASILVGNLLALRQRNIKRILAYSSIAHLGYMLVPVIAMDGGPAAEAVVFYLAAYVVTTLGAFGVVAVTVSPGGNEREDLADYRGLFWRRPALAAALTAMVLSLAGIPLTAGFIAKFVVVAAGAASALWGPLMVLVAGSVIGLFYYLRIVAVLFDRAEAQEEGARSPYRMSAVLFLLSAILLWLGVHPPPILRLVETAVRSLPL
jgi:NADH-quinone oxidoreductase subunit N